MIFTHNMFARTATAGATLLLLGGLTMPSNAFFAAFPQETRPDSRSVVKPPVDRSNALRPAWPRAPAAARIKPPATTTSADSTLAEKAAQGPLQIIISLDKQQLTLYAGGEAIAHFAYLEWPARPRDSDRRVQRDREGPLAPLQSL